MATSICLIGEKTASTIRWCRDLGCLLAVVLGALTLANMAFAADSSTCPQEGCRVKITEIKSAGSELRLTFEANFKPKMPGTHIHVWWGENFTIEQVGLNAQTKYGVPTGEWDYTDDYPDHSTHGPSSTHARSDAHTLCVSAADNNHNIVDISKFYCLDAKNFLPGSH